MKKLLIVLFILLFLFLNWNSFNAPFERDEGHYAYGAWIMTRGLTPYINTFEQKPPMIFYPYLVSLFINPNANWPPRLLADIFLFFSLILVGMAAARDYGRRVGGLSMGLMLIMTMFPDFIPFAANTERFLLLPLTATLAIYVYNRQGRSKWPVFWAAACGACAILFKQTALFPVSFIFIAWWYEARKESGRFLLSALAGAAASIIIFCGFFLLKGAWPYMLESMFEYNRSYIQATGGITLSWFWLRLQKFIYSWAILLFLLFWYLYRRPAHWRVYGGLFLVSLLAVFSSPYGHYYIMLVPFWAVISAKGLELVTGIFDKGKKGRILFPVAAMLLLLAVLLPSIKYYFLSSEELLNQLYSPLNPFVESPVMAQHVMALTEPADYVYVAGTEMQINYYAKRLNPSRFSGIYSLVMEQPKTVTYQQELVRDLEKYRPKAIVWVQSPLSWLIDTKKTGLILNYLHQLLAEKYSIVGGTVRKEGPAQWEEPVEKRALLKYSMLLFIRNQEAGK